MQYTPSAIPTIPMDTQHGMYKHPILELFKARANFKTQNGKGGRNYDQQMQFGQESYEPKITAYKRDCRRCNGKDTSYVVYSYATKIFENCENCDDTQFDVTFYSKQTKWLQYALAECFPQFNVEWEAYRDSVARARKWLTTARREKLGYDGTLDEETVLYLYNAYHDEM